MSCRVIKSWILDCQSGACSSDNGRNDIGRSQKGVRIWHTGSSHVAHGSSVGAAIYEYIVDGVDVAIGCVSMINEYGSIKII